MTARTKSLNAQKVKCLRSMTTITITQDTKKKLDRVGCKGQTYEDIVLMLVANYHKKVDDDGLGPDRIFTKEYLKK